MSRAIGIWVDTHKPDFAAFNPAGKFQHHRRGGIYDRNYRCTRWQHAGKREQCDSSVSIGRSRALEIVLSGDDFDADIAERYGWVNRTLDDDDLDSFVDALVRHLASFDPETLAAAKAQINRFGTPTDGLAGQAARPGRLR